MKLDLKDDNAYEAVIKEVKKWCDLRNYAYTDFIVWFNSGGYEGKDYLLYDGCYSRDVETEDPQGFSFGYDWYEGGRGRPVGILSHRRGNNSRGLQVQIKRKKREVQKK